jgi:hypothetical protein
MRSFLAPAAFLHFLPALAQVVLNEQIWGAVIYAEYGERTPYILPETNTLTPLGAQQMYQSGQFYRQRYVDTGDNLLVTSDAIQDISPYEINVDQIEIWSTVDQFIIASAQAFMQGLYPPLEDSSNHTFLDSESSLANGSNIEFPLNGYQYPQIYTASELDMNSIWISGEVNCPMYTSSRAEYFSSPQFLNTEAANADFYNNLEGSVLDGIFPNETVGYFNAYYIYDYLNYGYVHNTTVRDHVSDEDVEHARILADEWVFAMNGNISASGTTQGDHIRAISGRTLATRIIEALFENIHSAGDDDKMTLLFGSFEPMVAFAALAQLPEREPDFYGLPNLGATMVWELFSYTANDTTTEYPLESDLYVRFLFQNGTGSEAELISFPLFGRDPSQIVMTLDEFMAGMQPFVMSDVESWCNTCSSYSVFCPAFVNSDGNSSSGSSSASHRHGISPAVAGVIGAIVTLVVAGILFALVMLIGGVRFYRNHAKRRSELGGFKGGEKLASDADLTVQKSAVGASVQEAGPAKGHERVGSWELSDRQKAEEAAMRNSELQQPGSAMRKPSFEDDDLRVSTFSDPVKMRESV